MKVGRLRHRGILQRRVDAELEGGEIVPDFVTVAEIWISIEPMSGREYFTAQQIAADVTTSIKMRWRPGIDSTYRILHQISGDSPPAYEIYDITEALEDPIILRRWITLLCTKRFAEGFRT